MLTILAACPLDALLSGRKVPSEYPPIMPRATSLYELVERVARRHVGEGLALYWLVEPGSVSHYLGRLPPCHIVSRAEVWLTGDARLAHSTTWVPPHVPMPRQGQQKTKQPLPLAG